MTFEHIRENAINEIMKENNNEIEELTDINNSLKNMTLELKNEKEKLKNENKQYKKALNELKKLRKLDEESIQIINSLIN